MVFGDDANVVPPSEAVEPNQGGEPVTQQLSDLDCTALGASSAAAAPPQPPPADDLPQLESFLRADGSRAFLVD
jgi:hypothetical protein